jgi:hypothetical protein
MDRVRGLPYLPPLKHDVDFLIVDLENSQDLAFSALLATFEPSAFFLYFPMGYEFAQGNPDRHM